MAHEKPTTPTGGANPAPIIAQAPPTACYLNKREAARLLAISPRTLDGWLRRRLIPFYKLGKTVRLSERDIEQHLADRCRVAAVAQ